MTVYLHIGSHKTGTTAIQDFARHNRGWLEARGLLYPGYELTGGKPVWSHLRTFRELTGPDPALRAQSRALFAATAEALGDRSAFFSAESLFRFDADRVGTVCATLREAFGDRRIVVVCSLRPPAEFAESLYRNGYRVYAARPQPFPEWLEGHWDRFDYAGILRRFLDGLGAEAMLFPYSKETRDGFVARFFERLGVAGAAEAEVEAQQKNPSLDCVDCLAKAAVLGEDADADRSKAFNAFVFADPVRTGYGFLDRDREAAFAARAAEQNRELVEMDPAMAAVLGPDVAPMDLRPIDAEAEAMARDRAAGYAAARAA